MPYGSWDNTNKAAIADFGPAVNHKSLANRFGIPTPDHAIDFEDLMILAMNYYSVPKRIPVTGERSTELALEARESRQGDDLVVTLHLLNNGQQVKGASVELAYDPAQLEPRDISQGAVFGGASPYSFFARKSGSGRIVIDGAMIGTGRTTPYGGDLATIRFADYTQGGGHASLIGAKVRDGENNELAAVLRSRSMAVEMPRSYGLDQNYPNPFNPTTTIRYRLPEQSQVQVEVFNMLGARVATLAGGVKDAGYYSIEWNGRDDAGVMLQSGQYFCTMRAGAFTSTITLTLMK
jgi:hypothetical protein